MPLVAITFSNAIQSHPFLVMTPVAESDQIIFGVIVYICSLFISEISVHICTHEDKLLAIRILAERNFGHDHSSFIKVRQIKNGNMFEQG